MSRCLPNIGILETPTRSRIAGRAGCNSLSTSFGEQRLAMTQGVHRTSHAPTLHRRSSRRSTVSVAATFVNLLVAAGFCSRHSPRYRTFSSAANRLSSVEALQASIQYRERPTYLPSHAPPMKGVEEQLRGSNNYDVRDDDKLEIQSSPAPIEPKPPDSSGSRQCHSTRSSQHARNRVKFKHNDLRILFNFYADTLGVEEATNGLGVVLSDPDQQANSQRSSERDRRPGGDLTKPGVEHLVSLLSDKHSSNEAIFRAYEEVPSPAVSYLSEPSRAILLHRFSNPPRLRRDHAVRYLTIIDDMCKASLYISPYCWDTAIHLAGKAAGRVTEFELRWALDVWTRMENEGETTSSSGAFNILFDIAIKAGQFTIADKLVIEMKRRNVDFSRFGRVARIHYRGLQRDVVGVRQAYRDFVQEGEVVDTVVLNCVLVSLIRCDRFDLAQQMYGRMADAHSAISGQSNSDGQGTIFYPHAYDNYAAYRKASKRLGRVLAMGAILHDKLPYHHRVLQSALPLTPDSKTFHIFLSYHAFETGDLERFLATLRDMEVQFSIPPQGMVYILLFQGFAIHGNKPKTLWTLKRLQGVWATFLRAVDDSNAAIKQKISEKRITELKWENPLTGEKTVVANPSLCGNSGGGDIRTAPEPSLNFEADDWFRGPDDDKYESDEEDDDWRFENTVYLGRKLVVSSLKAFYVCGGRQAVLELWGEIRTRWCWRRPKPSDIAAVKDELKRLLG